MDDFDLIRDDCDLIRDDYDMIRDDYDLIRDDYDLIRNDYDLSIVIFLVQFNYCRVHKSLPRSHSGLS